MELTDDQIITALGNSGFLFEQACATAIEALGFHVETSWAFADSGQPKSRELDIRAVKTAHYDESNRLHVLVELLVECKDFEAPLVFLQSQKNRRELEFPRPNEFVFPRAEYEKTLETHAIARGPGFEHFGLGSSHYYYREKVKATQFVKVVRRGKDWVANHDGVYDALVIPLAKALESRKTAVKRSSPGNYDWAHVWLFFPMVLVRNRLLVYQEKTSSQLAERGRGRVSHVRALDMPPLQGHYLIDFVAFDRLQSFINDEVMSFVGAVCELASTDPRRLRGNA